VLSTERHSWPAASALDAKQFYEQQDREAK